MISISNWNKKKYNVNGRSITWTKITCNAKAMSISSNHPRSVVFNAKSIIRIKMKKSKLVTVPPAFQFIAWIQSERRVRKKKMIVIGGSIHCRMKSTRMMMMTNILNLVLRRNKKIERVSFQMEKNLWSPKIAAKTKKKVSSKWIPKQFKTQSLST